MSAPSCGFCSSRVAKTLSTITSTSLVGKVGDRLDVDDVEAGVGWRFAKAHLRRPFQRIFPLVQVRTVDDGGFHTVFRQDLGQDVETIRTARGCPPRDRRLNHAGHRCERRTYRSPSPCPSAPSISAMRSWNMSTVGFENRE